MPHGSTHSPIGAPLPGDGDHPEHDAGWPHPHAHAHSQAHGDGFDRIGRAFAFGLVLNTGFVVLEGAYGVIANSLSLLADAAHNLGDVLSLALAWGATILSRRQPSGRRTYGLRKSSIMASLANAVLLLVVSGGLAWEAVLRFGNPQPIAELDVVIVAAVGVAINGVTALLFMADRKRDLNIRGAFLHMAADAAVSLGVVATALAMAATGWLWLDPATSLGIVAVIAIGTWGLLRASLDLALDAVPSGIDPQAVAGYLQSLPGVTAVHDLHIWAMSTTEAALTAHLVRPNAAIDDAWLADVSEELRVRFAIPHATIQIENGATSQECPLAPADVV